MRSDDLQKHIYSTYFDMRVGVGVIALAYPLILWLGGLVIPEAAVELQPSISAYYHTPMRNVFVGVLFIVGSFLYLYRGYSQPENQLLNLAGILAVCIALFPTSLTCDPNDPVCLARAREVFAMPKVHGASAILFFVCIGSVCIYESGIVSLFEPGRTLKLIRDESRANVYKGIYGLLGLFMVVLPVLAACCSLFWEAGLPPTRQHWTYRAEFSAIYVFGAYWIIKSWEIYKTEKDLNAPLWKMDT